VFELNDKKAVVTGGGSGIGRAIATLFAERGACVHVVDLNEAASAGVVEEIRAQGGQALGHACDVSRQADVKALMERIGPIDILVNNAGIAHIGKADDTSEEDFDRVMAVNAKGVWLAMKYELKQMQKQSRGAIVNNASAVGVVGTGRGAASYAASKHAVVGLTKAAALENARLGIRVNVVAPAVIDTDMGAGFASDLKITMQEFGRVHPVGRVGTPDEVANAVLWLCSSDASFVTGHTLMIDGGMTAQ